MAVKTDAHNSMQGSPAPENKPQERRDREDSENEGDMQLAGGRSLSAVLAPLPARLAAYLRKQLWNAGKTPEGWHKTPMGWVNEHGKPVDRSMAVDTAEKMAPKQGTRASTHVTSKNSGAPAKPYRSGFSP